MSERTVFVGVASRAYFRMVRPPPITLPNMSTFVQDSICGTPPPFTH